MDSVLPRRTARRARFFRCKLIQGRTATPRRVKRLNRPSRDYTADGLRRRRMDPTITATPTPNRVMVWGSGVVVSLDGST